jgi:hypothetical protein
MGSQCLDNSDTETQRIAHFLLRNYFYLNVLVSRLRNGHHDGGTSGRVLQLSVRLLSALLARISHW